MEPVALVVAVAEAVLIGVLTRPILRRLPAPVDEPDADPYRPLATTRFAAATAALTLAAGLLTGWLLSVAQLAAWASLNTLGVLLACIDARTTFLPAVLNRAAWLAAIVGVLVSGALLGDPLIVARVAAGAALGAGLFWALWRIANAFGFGDVRLAALTGGTAGAVAWLFPVVALMAGSIAGGLLGVVALLRRGQGFPYGPALVLGPYLALAAVNVNATL